MLEYFLKSHKLCMDIQGICFKYFIRKVHWDKLLKHGEGFTLLLISIVHFKL